MDRKLRILGRTLHKGGSKWLRLGQHLDILQRMGLADCGDVTSSDDPDLVARAVQSSDILVSSAGAGVQDTVDGLQSEITLDRVRTLMDGLGVRWVWDVDDNYWNLSPYNPAYEYYGLEEVDGDGTTTPRWKHGEKGFDLNRNRRTAKAFAKVLGRMSALTTTTEYLRQKLLKFNDNVLLRPNVLDFDEIWTGMSKPSFDGCVRILYAGGASHFKDLEMVLPVLIELAKVYDGTQGKPEVKFLFFGAVDTFAKKGLPEDRLERIDWTSGYRIYARRLQTLRADIGIAPLNMDEPFADFNRCKSPVKWSEYAAVGLPAVCTNDHPYSPVVKCATGMKPESWNGWLADSPEDWYYALAFLIENPELRRAIGFNAHWTVKSDYDALKWGPTYLEQYEELWEPQLSQIGV